MGRDWTTISLYLDRQKYDYYSELADIRDQSRNSLLVQLIDFAIRTRHKDGTLLENWENDNEPGPKDD